MNTKIKHSKIKNTGILFELLTRQITVDIMNDKNGKAVSILKNYFSPKTELGKEYGLYKILTTEKFNTESKADHLINAVLSFLWQEFQITKCMLLFLSCLKLKPTPIPS